LKVETSQHENGCQAKISKFQVWAVDGDGAFIPLRFDFCLTESLRRTLKSGALLQLTGFFPIYYDHGNNSDMRAALFVKKCEILGHHAGDDGFGDAPPVGTPTTVIVKPFQRVQAEITKAAVATTGAAEHHSFHGQYPCDGTVCSRRNAAFDRCVTKVSPVADLVLHEVAQQCFFVTVTVEEMDASWKQNILYHWCAPNIYQIGRRECRKELPRFLVTACHSRCVPQSTW